MTVGAVLYAFVGAVWLTLTAFGLAEIRTGRVLWKPASGSVTNARAHGGLLISIAALSASQAAVVALDGPGWLLALVVIACFAALSTCSVIAHRRPRTPPPPTRGTSPPDQVTVEELFRRHHDDRDP